MRRREGAGLVARRLELPIVYGDTLDDAGQRWSDAWRQADQPDATLRIKHPLPPAVNPVPWLRAVAGREDERCSFCVRLRLLITARQAKAGGYQAFTSSLLYSRYQNHDEIRALGEQCAQETGVAFYYEDFRSGWQEGVTLSREWGIYRQPYCGCIFSEYERYAGSLAKIRAQG